MPLYAFMAWAGMTVTSAFGPTTDFVHTVMKLKFKEKGKGIP
jgi:hypothetical protein